MEILPYLELAQKLPTLDKSIFLATPNITIITNFTDALLGKIFTGGCLDKQICPDVYSVPYKQYLFELKNKGSELYRREPNITYIFFDVNPYNYTEFAKDGHFNEILKDLNGYCEQTGGAVVLNTFITPYRSPERRWGSANGLFELVKKFNEELKTLAAKHKNVYLCDTNAIVHNLGEYNIRDWRNLYAFDLPFTLDFFGELSAEWLNYLLVLRGKAKKCIILDLDNVLWGGVIGEAGLNGIQLGPDYPGNAYVNFQRNLLKLYEHGIILAINSKNNLTDVDEVFVKHPHMVLTKQHFAAICVNWNNKAENITAIANELNLGLDSFIFIDDDPLNRNLVKESYPQVLVPEFSFPPENYVPALLSLNVFNHLSLTEEDRKRNQMYAEERERKELKQSAVDIKDYLKKLDIIITVKKNDPATFPRVSQLSLKSNQFNLTTKRYSENDINNLTKDRAAVYTGEVEDKFGKYGITLVAIIKLADNKTAELNTFFMSCRVIGRSVEQSFLHQIINELAKNNITTLTAVYLPTAKNILCKEFLPAMNFSIKEAKPDGSIFYTLNLNDYLKKEPPFLHGFVTLKT